MEPTVGLLQRKRTVLVVLGSQSLHHGCSALSRSVELGRRREPGALPIPLSALIPGKDLHPLGLKMCPA